jgi:FkbM family methyltransferase
MLEALQQLKDMGFYPDFVIDVGTAYGTYPLLSAFPKSFFIWIEPIVEFEKKIQKLQHKYKGDYFIAAAGKQPGKGIINIHKDLVGSSLLKEMDGFNADGEQREINMVTIDNLLTKYAIDKESNILLKLDVQGFELEALEGAKEILEYCEAILLEVSFFNFQKDSPDFYDVINYMKKIGYVAYDIFDGLNRPIDNALAQKDMLFVKESGIFRQTRRFAKNR